MCDSTLATNFSMETGKGKGERKKEIYDIVSLVIWYGRDSTSYTLQNVTVA